MPAGRRASAVGLGVAVALAVFAVMLGAGMLLFSRLWGDSTAWLVLVLLAFGLGGAYAGWIVGLLVYSAVWTGTPVDVDEERDPPGPPEGTGSDAPG